MAESRVISITWYYNVMAKSPEESPTKSGRRGKLKAQGEVDHVHRLGSSGFDSLGYLVVRIYSLMPNFHSPLPRHTFDRST
jgi:hypothetical protein